MEINIHTTNNVSLGVILSRWKCYIICNAIRYLFAFCV